MSPERWQKIEDVFQAVVDLAPAERLSFLNTNYADDADLIAEIERLISDYEDAGDFIESPVWTDSFMLGATVRDKIGGAIDHEIQQDKGGMIGKRLGVYLLTKELGRGGMGAVYLAERADGEFRQRVALKVIKRGMDTDFIVRRFRNERQILASLDHQNIARLLDGGTTDDGLPFFVMEYIEGSPVYRFSDAKKLSIHERLRLFIKICDAVDYAHENLIIHRDIKPTNILVTGDGMPKLLDFGIAKILNPELAADSIDPTATAMRMMTPEYASPEQVRGEVVTKTSDIYSLGVLLYELLTGHRPYRLKNRALHEIARVICEEQPDDLASILTREENFVPTSTNDEKTTLEAIFESRSSNLETLKRELSGDLQKVVFKALHKNTEDRYQSAKELAEDIARYLAGAPVLAPAFLPAQPAFAQAVHRSTNPDEISVAVLPLKLFGASASGDTGDEYLCIGLADALITRLSNVRRFVVRPTSSVLKYGHGDTEPIAAGNELGVNYLIDGNIRRVGSRLRVTVQLLNIQEGAARWAEKFDEEFTDVLTLEDIISEKIAEALMPQLTGDERDKLKKRGTNSSEAFEHYLRGRHYWNSFTEDGFAKAIVAYYQAIAFDPNYALAYAGIADYHNWLGVYGVLPSKECFQSAVENAKQAIAIDPELGEAYASLAFAQHGGNFEWEESERNFQTALRLNPNVAETHVWYSIKLTTEGRFTEGIRHAERAVELDRQTPFNQHNLGWIQYYSRRFDKSLRQYQTTAEMFPNYPLAHYGLAWVLRYLGRFEEAVEHANLAQQLMNETVFSLHVQGQTFAAAGMREQAEVILEKLEQLAEKQFVSKYHTALIYAFLDEKDKALTLLEDCAQKSDAWLVWLGVEPGFDSLRSEPRFKAVMASTRNPILARDEIGIEKANPTIAVLPFKVMSAASTSSTDDKFLGVGLADALITRLSNVRRFTVRPTSSVLRYDTENNPFSAGGELGVDYLIDGNIRRVGETLRVTVQLLSIEQGATRWAQRFDEDVADFLTLEDSISEQIVTELLPQLTGEDRAQLKKRGTNNAEAYEHYLRGRYFWNKFTTELFPKAFEEFNEAVRLDPNFANAYVGIADFYVWLCIFGVLPSLEAFPKAKEAAQKALELDPNLGEAYTTLAFVTTIFDWDWERAEQLFKRALELSPNYALAHEWYSNLLVVTGRFDEAVEEAQRAVELDPLSARGRVLNAWMLYQTRHFRRATAEAERAVEMEKDFPQGLMHVGNALDKAGRSEEAVTALRESIRLWSDGALPKSMLCHALVNAGREDEAREVLQEILAEAEKNYVKPYFLAVAYAAFDERDAAFEWLEKAYSDRNEWLVWLGTEPKFDNLREDRRYFEMLERMKNPIVRQQKNESTILASGTEITIAVLPLKTLLTGKTANTEEEFLGIGLADALVTRLSSVKRLTVRPTNSVIRSGKNNTDPFAIAQEVNAGFIVDGHVKRIGDRLRVSVQLLNAAEQTAVWAKSFDEKFTDVLTVEDSVSEQIAAALLPQLTDDERQKLQKRPTDNAKAFEAYIRGRYHWNSFTEDGLQKSLLAYREALEYDPNFALAYAGIADFYNFLCIFGSKSPILSFPAAKEAAQKAIELNPNLAEAQVALGVTAFGYDWNFAEGERLFKKALELNPNYAVAHFWYALVLCLKGDHENGLREMRRAEQLSPGIPSLMVIHAFVLRNARKFDKSLEKIRQALAVQPNYYVAVQGFGWVVKWTKNYDEAEEITLQSVEQTKRFSLPLYAYGYVLAVRGKHKEALKIVKELKERRDKQYIPAIYLSLIYTELGEFDAAFEWLDKSFEEREFWAIWLPVDPRFDALRKDRRYNDFINRLKPQDEPDEDIHQSHIATRIFPVTETKVIPKIEAPKEKETPAEEAFAPKKPHRKYWIAAAAASVVIGVFAVLAFSGILKITGNYAWSPSAQTAKPPLPPKKANEKRIAVLPFETDSNFENEESFAFGLSEAVGQKLRQVKEISMGRVLLRLKNKPTLEELARDYSVSYALSGRLHVEGERLVVDAELVDTADGKTVWSEKFDENVNNLQNLQTSISEKVLKALTIELSANERQQISKNSTENNEAYQLYLVGRYQLSNRSAANINKAIKTFEKARSLDPKFALAYAGLADAYALLNLYQIPPPADAYDNAKLNALKAIELDPNLAEAHASLGYVLFYHEHKREEGVAELMRAIDLNPGYSPAHHWLSLMLSAMGRHDEAIRSAEKAVELEPRSAIIQTSAGLVYFYARKYDEALKATDKVLETNEGFVPVYKTKRVVFEAMGNYSAALTAYQNERIYSENTDENDEGWLMIAAQVQAVGGNREEALANLKRAGENAFVKKNPASFAFEIAAAYALLGETEKALEWLKKSKDVKGYSFSFAQVDPRLDKIRHDPRFIELTK